MYKIREALQSDCDGIGKVYCDSWKTAYQNLLPQTYLDLLTVEDCISDKASEISHHWCEKRRCMKK